MAFLDGAGSALWGSWRNTGMGGAKQVFVCLVAPGDYTRMALNNFLTVLVDNKSTSVLTDVQWAVSTDPTFATGVLVNNVERTNLADGFASLQLTSGYGLPQNTKLYWRARGSQVTPYSYYAWQTGWRYLTTDTSNKVGGAASYTASSFYPSSPAGAWVAANAFDGVSGDAGHTWASKDGRFPCWLQANFAFAQQVGGYSIQARTTSPYNNQAPSAWELQGSNDGTTWVTLDTQRGVTFAPSQIRTFPFAQVPTAYKSFRLWITANNGSAANTSIAEMAFYRASYLASSPAEFVLDQDYGKARVELYENVILTPPVSVSSDGFYAYENAGYVTPPSFAGEAFEAYESVGLTAGVDLVPDSDGVLEATENVGFNPQKSPDGITEGYLGSVSTSQPTPHIWGVYYISGFVGDTVQVIGQGLAGATIATYASKLYLQDRQTTGSFVNRDVSSGMTLGQYAAAIDAVGANRSIFTGDYDDPPAINVEYQTLTSAPVPAAAGPDPTKGPVNDVFYVTHATPAAKTSNYSPPWLIYPVLDIDGATIDYGLRTIGYVRLASAEYPGEIDQNRMAYTMPAYTIARGRAELYPILATGVRSKTQLGHWSSSPDLSVPLSVTLDETRRWLPDPAKLVAHPEVGTGIVWWEPTTGTNTMSWQFEQGELPYVLPDYTVATNHGDIDMPAMIFPGDAWGSLTANLPSGPDFALAIVAVLQAPPGGLGTIVYSYPNGVPDANSWPMKLVVQGALMSAQIEDWGQGAIAGLQPGSNARSYASTTLEMLSERPIIMFLNVTASLLFLRVMDLAPSTVSFNHSALTRNNSRLWLAQGQANTTGPWGDLQTTNAPMAMDVLDVIYWDHSIADPKLIAAYMSRLDGIYGVSKR